MLADCSIWMPPSCSTKQAQQYGGSCIVVWCEEISGIQFPEDITGPLESQKFGTSYPL